MGCDSIDALKAVFPQLKQMLEDDDAFRDYYQFCFKFAMEPGFGGARCRRRWRSRCGR